MIFDKITTQFSISRYNNNFFFKFEIQMYYIRNVSRKSSFEIIVNFNGFDYIVDVVL